METRNVICDNCGNKFEIQKYTIRYTNGNKIIRFPKSKYCSLKCSAKSAYIRRYKYYQNYWLTRKNLWKWKEPKICEVCNIEYNPKSPKAKTCSRKCSSKRWKILNIEKSRAYNNASAKRCREQDPERYRFYVKNRKHKIREASGGISSKTFSTIFTLNDWKNIKLKYDNKCAECGIGDIKLTIDHIQPLSKGGKHSVDNIQPLCHSCNSRKKDKIF